MKVLHVIPSVGSVRGGPSRAVLEMVRELRLQGIDTEIVTTNDNGDDELEVPLCQRVEYPVDQSSTVPIWFFPRFSPAIISIREFTFSASLTSWLWQHITDYNLIHVHAIFSYVPTIAMTIARLRGVPYIQRPIGQLCHWSLQQSALKKQLYLNLIERANLQASRFLHFTSIQEQQEAESLGLSTPSYVLPHGLTLPVTIPDASHNLRPHLAIQDNVPIILFLSRLHPKKGLDNLIAALGACQHFPFAFVIAGNGTAEYEAEIHQKLTDAGIQSRTHHLGFVSGELKDLLLQGADLFALTSYSENFGIAVLESLAAGTPVLLTEGVALASTVTQHQLGWVTLPEKTSIIAALQQFLAHPTLTQSMGDRARQVVQQEFTWSQVVTHLIDRYTSSFDPSALDSSTASLSHLESDLTLSSLSTHV